MPSIVINLQINVAVCVFNDVKHLSFSEGEGTVVALIEDFIEIADPPKMDTYGEVVGVTYVEEYMCCVGCKGKVIRDGGMWQMQNEGKDEQVQERCNSNVAFEADNGLQKNFIIFEQLKKCGDSSPSWEENVENKDKKHACCYTYLQLKFDIDCTEHIL